MRAFRYVTRLLSGPVGKAAAIAALAVAFSAPAKALTITPSFVDVPADAETAINNTITEFEHLFSNPVTVTIEFDWGFVADLGDASLELTSGAAAYYPQFLDGTAPQYSFNTTKALYQNASATVSPGNTVLASVVKNLPATAPTPSDSSRFFIASTQYSALTGTTLLTPNPEAYAGFAADFCGVGVADCTYDYSGGTPSADEIDFNSVAEHEIAHALGRFDDAYNTSADPKAGGAPPFLAPLDFTKYDCGTPNLDPTFSNTCFSIDGGATDLQAGTAGIFDDTSDSSDWRNTANCGGSDSFDACINTGVEGTMSTVDIIEMCSLGWDAVPCPEPSSMALLGAPLFGLGFLRRRRRRCRPAAD